MAIHLIISQNFFSEEAPGHTNSATDHQEIICSFIKLVQNIVLGKQTKLRISRAVKFYFPSPQPKTLQYQNYPLVQIVTPNHESHFTKRIDLELPKAGYSNSKTEIVKCRYIPHCLRKHRDGMKRNKR